MTQAPCKTTRKQSDLEIMLLSHIRAVGLPEPQSEYRFDPKRRFRADFAYPGLSLLIEVEGGIWANGRHTRGSGYEGDCRKYNHAGLLGFTVLRFTPGMIESGEAVKVIENALDGTSARPRGER